MLPQFYSGWTLAYGMLLPSFRVHSPCSVKPFWKHSLRDTHRCVSMVILNAVKLTMKINNHRQSGIEHAKCSRSCQTRIKGKGVDSSYPWPEDSWFKPFKEFDPQSPKCICFIQLCAAPLAFCSSKLPELPAFPALPCPVTPLSVSHLQTNLTFQ